MLSDGVAIVGQTLAGDFERYGLVSLNYPDIFVQSQCFAFSLLPT